MEDNTKGEKIVQQNGDKSRKLYAVPNKETKPKIILYTKMCLCIVYDFFNSKAAVSIIQCVRWPFRR